MNKWANIGKAAVLGIVAVAGLALFYVETRATVAQPNALLFPLIYSAVAVGLLRLFGVPNPWRASRTERKPSTVFADAGYAALAFAGMFVVASVGPRHLPDTALGAAGLFVPFFAFFAIGMYFIARLVG